MARRSLTVLFILAAGLASCQSDAEKIAAAAAAKAVAEARPVLPDMPEDCVAKMRRPPRPVVGQPARWQERRWNDAADARDRQATNCDAFWNQYKAGKQ
jgi:hypothetical protein